MTVRGSSYDAMEASGLGGGGVSGGRESKKCGKSKAASLSLLSSSPTMKDKLLCCSGKKHAGRTKPKITPQVKGVREREREQRNSTPPPPPKKSVERSRA